jgi:hypothetical protein
MGAVDVGGAEQVGGVGNRDTHIAKLIKTIQKNRRLPKFW